MLGNRESVWGECGGVRGGIGKCGGRNGKVCGGVQRG